MTPEQREIMRHALGYGRRTPPGWRNHFVTGLGSTDYPHCEALVAAGLMRRYEGHALSGGDPVYSVTDAGRAALRETPNTCKLTECQGKPRCATCLSMDAAYPRPTVDATELLPHAYLLAKLAMVMPLFQEARDALTAIREDQRIRHGISKTLADRMDIAGTYSIDDWRNPPNVELRRAERPALDSEDATTGAGRSASPRTQG